jgi:hypothetical protein
LDRAVIGIASVFELVSDVPQGVVVGQKAQRALGEIPGDIDLAQGR